MRWITQVFIRFAAGWTVSCPSRGMQLYEVKERFVKQEIDNLLSWYVLGSWKILAHTPQAVAGASHRGKV